MSGMRPMPMRQPKSVRVDPSPTAKLEAKSVTVPTLLACPKLLTSPASPRPNVPLLLTSKTGMLPLLEKRKRCLQKTASLPKLRTRCSRITQSCALCTLATQSSIFWREKRKSKWRRRPTEATTKAPLLVVSTRELGKTTQTLATCPTCTRTLPSERRRFHIIDRQRQE